MEEIKQVIGEKSGGTRGTGRGRGTSEEGSEIFLSFDENTSPVFPHDFQTMKREFKGERDCVRVDGRQDEAARQYALAFSSALNHGSFWIKRMKMHKAKEKPSIEALR